jgi:putative transcriptional regulator
MYKFYKLVVAVLGQKKLLYATLIVKFPFEKQSISINTLRELCAAKEWLQSDLANKLEVSRQTVNAIETEKYNPSSPLAFKAPVCSKNPSRRFSDWTKIELFELRRGWKKFQPRFCLITNLIKLMLTLTLLSCIKRKNKSIFLND